MKNQFFSDDEEKRLGKIVRTALRVRPSAPSRTPCPHPDIIRDIAFHREIDSKTLKKVALHIAGCYECARLAEKYAHEYEEQSKQGCPAS